MTERVRPAFEGETRILAIDRILPARAVSTAQRQTRKYASIRNSIQEVGVIEPLVIYPHAEDTYLLLDGHLRLDVLKALGAERVACLVATDDEGYTYNRHVNRISPVQEHYMIREAIDRGVPAERIAKALNVDVVQIRQRQALLKGIAPEAIELIKDRHLSRAIFGMLKKMKPLRQVEVLELMIAANRCTENYARALLAATPANQLAHPERPKRIPGVTAETIAKMEREMDSLQRDYKVVEEAYGSTMLNLVVAKGYVGRLLANAEVARYLEFNHPDLKRELEGIIAAIHTDAAE